MSLTTAKSIPKIRAYECREIILLCMEEIHTAFDTSDYN